MFCHITQYLKASDLNIAVLEGPLAIDVGSITNTTLYDQDNIIKLNFPDEFGKNIKDAGIHLVTMAGNHLFDQDEKGVYLTIEKLNKIGLEHCGAYRSPEEQEKNKIKIVTVKGLKIAVLCYTYGCNGIQERSFFEEYNYYTNIIVDKSSKYYEQCLQSVVEDFNRAKSLNPDCIICLPHWGGQGDHTPNQIQRDWMEIFIENGADIILGDHPHAVQPILWKKNARGRNVFVAYCPGHFVNSYTERDGDASMLIEVYLNPNNGEPISSSIVPIYAYTPYQGIITGIPIYDFVRNDHLLKRISQYDYNRISKCYKIVTSSAISEALTIDQSQKYIYYFPEAGYVRNRCQPISLSQEDKQKSIFLRFIEEAESICFIGDSISEGTKNGGYGWFDPIISNYPEKRIAFLVKGGATSLYIIRNIDLIKDCNANLYVIAIGCNDIRYRNPQICAMNSKDFISNVDVITNRIRTFSPKCKFVFIEPWHSDFRDRNCKLKHEDKEYMYVDYSNALQNYCKINKHLYITPNKYIWEILSKKYIGYYLIDFIHPNAREGIQLYSKAVIKTSYNGKD